MKPLPRVLIILLLVLTPLPAMAEKVAMVIGMGAYQHVIQLKNTVNDARHIGATLKRAGFKVTYAINETQSQLLDALKVFSFQAETADVAVIYYAGHGVEVGGENYLIPVDAQVASNKDVLRVSVSLKQLLKAVDSARKIRVVILDACRDNPFGDLVDTSAKTGANGNGTGTRSAGQKVGLAPVNPDQGTLVAFAAKQGEVALDGSGQDSPYALALMHKLDVPGLEISLMFRQVRDEVLKATDNLQEPYTYGSLSGTPYYLAGPGKGNTNVNKVTDPRVAWSDLRPNEIQQLRALAKRGSTRSMLGLAYISQNPNDTRYNPAEALKYFKKAAAAGSPEAEFELAKIYEQGLGVTPDPAKALKLYKASADQGFAAAQNNLGIIYFQGELGVKADRTKGMDYIGKAADLRDTEAMFNFADMIELGLVPGMGHKDAARYLYNAVRAGSKKVLYQLSHNASAFSVKTRIALQKELAKHNFYKGKFDGQIGPASVTAIRRAFGLTS